MRYSNLLVAGFSVIALVSCADRSPALDFQGRTLYLGEHVDTVTATRLIEYLEQERIFESGSRVLRFEKVDSGYILSIVSPRSVLPVETAVRRAGHLGRELSTAVLGGDPVTVELVDQGFRPYAVAPFRAIQIRRTPDQLFTRMSGRWKADAGPEIEIHLNVPEKVIIIDSTRSRVTLRRVDTLGGVVVATADLLDFRLELPHYPQIDSTLLLIDPRGDTVRLIRRQERWDSRPE